MSDYDSDEMLSQALDAFEERQANQMFLTQSTYRTVPDNEKEDIFSILENAVDVSDMLDSGGASEKGAERSKPSSNLKTESTLATTDPADIGKKYRFKRIGQQQMEVLSKPLVPANTLRKSRWAVTLFNEWVSEMLHCREDPVVVSILENESDLLKLTIEHLNTALCSFVLSLRKKNGGEYTSGSLFSIVTSIQKHLEVNGRRVSLLSDPQFEKLKTCLDNTMQHVVREGVGLVKRQAQVISTDQENYLWEMGILGNGSPQALLYAIFWTIGVNFGLRGGDEHRNLTLDNFKVHKDQEGNQYLEYCESISKTYKGGIKHRKIDPHKARAYEIRENKRCPVSLFQHYVSKLNPKSTASAFYYQPLSKVDGDVWFSLSPVGHNKLKDIVKTIMKSGGFDGYFTNHSLRATTATRLFQQNIPEQLIMEQTGHRSTAVYSYKRASDEQKRLVSSVLQNTNCHDLSTLNHVSATGISAPQDKQQHVFNMSNSEIHIHFGQNKLC